MQFGVHKHFYVKRISVLKLGVAFLFSSFGQLRYTVLFLALHLFEISLIGFTLEYKHVENSP